MIGLGLGLNMVKPFGGYIQRFFSRATKDGGTVEAKACLKEELARIEAI